MPVKKFAWSAPIDAVNTTDAYPHPALTLNRIAITETLIPTPASKTFLTSENGVAGTLHPYGKGQAVRLAVLPAVTFVHDALSTKKSDGFLPQGYRTEVAQFIAWPAELAGVPQVGVAYETAPKAVLKRWDGPGRSVVFVIDWAGEPNKDFAVTLPDAAHFTKIRTAHGAKVTVTRDEKKLIKVAFPLNVADAIILEK